MIDLLPDGEARFEELVAFMEAMHHSHDLDPLYPVLRKLENNFNREQSLWLSFLYVAWYNLPSAWKMFCMTTYPTELACLWVDPKWPTGTERRANRGGKVIEHIQDYMLKIAGSRNQHHWYTKDLQLDEGVWAVTDELEGNWEILNSRLQTLHMNGRWAGYKHCEVLQKVNDIPVTAPHMGHVNSSGPRQGLAMLYDCGGLTDNSPDTIAELDAMGWDLVVRLRKATSLHLEVEDVETILCNWKSLMKGKYYVGHDIDELQEQILKAEERGILSKEEAAYLWRARKAVLPHEYLGELQGWHGVDRRRMQAYRATGKIEVRS
jgi:hypothetical protein